MVQIIGGSAWISDTVEFQEEVQIGHSSCIGYDPHLSGLWTIIGARTRIGAFCVISAGVKLGDDIEIDHYCRIESGTAIGKSSKLLYGIQIFQDVQIGENCIVGGDVADRTIIEDEVTFMGNIAHSHRIPTDVDNWDETEEPSPIIHYGSVVGVQALVIGGVEIGPQAYVAAGEIVRCDIPPRTVLYKGMLMPLADWRGVIKVRGRL